MGPRLFSRGDDQAGRHGLLKDEASMGPRLSSRGDGSLGSTLLSCGDGGCCERSPFGGTLEGHSCLVKGRRPPLTWPRALGRDRGVTGALARERLHGSLTRSAIPWREAG